MQTILQNNSLAEGQLNNTALTRGIISGLIGGLVSTIASGGQSNGAGVKVEPVR